MSQLRQDPITRDWVVINPARAKRPHDTTGSVATPCPFCPGSEGLTPDEVDRLAGDDGRWRVRVVPNRFPALGPDVRGENATAANRWHSRPGFGYHEVIVESPDHAATLGTMALGQVRDVLAMYARRFRAIAARDPRVRQVVLFRNQGARAGTSLSHPHSQIVATPVVSPEIRRRMSDEIAYYDAANACGLCDTLAAELAARDRILCETPRFVTFAPFASRMPYQLQVVPRVHCPTFPEVDDATLDDLAPHLRDVLATLQRQLGEAHFNLVVMTPPLDQVHRLANHWFIEINPRLSTPAGFEMGSRIVVNTTTPETAVAELRAAAASHAREEP